MNRSIPRSPFTTLLNKRTSAQAKEFFGHRGGVLELYSNDNPIGVNWAPTKVNDYILGLFVNIL